MYLDYLVQEEAVRNEITNNEDMVLKEFKESFDINQMGEEIIENLSSFIVANDMVETYNKIKEYSKNKTLAYLTIKSKELAES